MVKRNKKAEDPELAQTREPPAKRRYVSQTDVPLHTLFDSLRVPQAISDQYGKQPTSPLDVARALDIMPTSSRFRTLTGAALAYGLTDGGPNAKSIGITQLGLRIVSPTVDGDDLAAKREAVLKPRVMREFLQKYHGSKTPSEHIGKNVLESMGVPADATERTLQLILGSAESVGLLVAISGQKVVNIEGSLPESGERLPREEPDGDRKAEEHGSWPLPPEEVGSSKTDDRVEAAQPSGGPVRNRKVYISHGSNKKIVEQLKELLTYGDFEPVVSVERESTARPVSEKVLGEMRSCSAGIIHVGAEQVIVDADGAEHPILNYNVLIEIGAAMALYGTNYVLLVEEGTKLPSNLQGLYEARYSGDVLNYDSTMKLLRALKGFKS